MRWRGNSARKARACCSTTLILNARAWLPTPSLAKPERPASLLRGMWLIWIPCAGWRAAVAEFGRLDICVCNAGLTSWGNFFDYGTEDFERVVNVNLRGSYFLAQAAARQFREQGNGGRIVLMSSVTGHQAVPYLSAYGMTKAALEMLARNLVLELSPHGITINCVAPGAVLTPRNLKDDPDYERRWADLIPVGKAIESEDIAEAVLFLASPAAEKITGQALVVDGGWTRTSPIPDMSYGSNYEN